MFLTNFIYRLRDYGVPVSLTDTVDFYSGLERGLAPDLESLFVFARLSFVRRVSQMDAFERAFAFHFYGLDLPRVTEGDPELLYTKQFREWLKQAVRKGELPPQAMWTMSPEELMKRFWDTVREQMKAHQGGSKWVGTGGTSPFGHSGNSRGGVRVFGSSQHRSALKVIGERRYVDYADATALKGENLRQALTTLKSLVPTGPYDELDIDETIDQSARNGGEIELAFRRALMDRIEVVLLIDNGGHSMLPFVELSRLLFAKVRDRFRRSSVYFFHNSIYGSVYKDPQRTQRLPTTELLRRNPETRVLVVGDASMAPEELIVPHGASDYHEDDQEASLVWLRRLRLRFPRTVWLNPIPKEDWTDAYGRTTIAKIGEVFEMEDLTLGGIKRAVSFLGR